MKAFYRIKKALFEFEALFGRNDLTQDIEKMAYQLPIYFNNEQTM